MFLDVRSVEFAILNDSQLAKLKRVFLSCYLHEIIGIGVGLKYSNFTLKIIWGEYVKFGAISISKNRYFVNNCLIKVPT